LTADVAASVQSIDDPGRFADTIASHLPIQVSEKQQILELVSPRERLEALCTILARELEIVELEKRIETRVRKQMEGSQRDYYLREQMKAIQKELGEKDERSAETEQLRAAIARARMPKAVREKALHELKRLERMPTLSAEAG